MLFLRDPRPDLFQDTGACVTLGNFDGLHRGHQHLLTEMVLAANRTSRPAVLVTFSPHPRTFFTRQPQPILTSLREQWAILSRLGVTHYICLRFNAAFANQPPEAFIENYLVKRLNVSEIWVGEEFRFGKDREGDVGFLKRLGTRFQYVVHSIPKVLDGNHKIGSRDIREALAEGNLLAAKRMLGRDPRIVGRVAYGARRGRLLGFPTANIRLNRRLPCLGGVFGVLVKGLGEQVRYGVANLGKRPTVDGGQSFLEVHLFDFDANIYGQCIEVIFLHKIRDEKKFPDIEALKDQIGKDVSVAKNWLSAHKR